MATIASVICDLDELIAKLKSTYKEAVQLREFTVMDLPDDIVSLVKEFVGDGYKIIDKYEQVKKSFVNIRGNRLSKYVEKDLSHCERLYLKTDQRGCTVEFKQKAKQYRMIKTDPYLGKSTIIIKDKTQFFGKQLNKYYAYRKNMYLLEWYKQFKLGAIYDMDGKYSSLNTNIDYINGDPEYKSLIIRNMIKE